MGTFGMDMFKSKERREIEARIEFNKNKRAFTKYFQELDVTIKQFTKMAKDAEISGNHADAINSAKFVLKLQKVQTKVQGLLHRFEMMNAMQRLSGVMTSFADACAKMGYRMNKSINLKVLMKDITQIDTAIANLDAMTDQMDQVFDTIDSGMSNTGGEIVPPEEMDDEARRLLDKIMERNNNTNYPDALQQGTAEPAAMESTPEAADDTDEKLRRLMEDLKS